MEFADKNNIIRRAGGLLPEKEADERDHILGVLGDTPPVITQEPLSFWNKFKPTPEIQRMRDGDTNACVTFSCINAYEYYFNYLMSIDPEVKPVLETLGCIDENGSAAFSDRFTAQMSGTNPNAGNTVSAVLSSINNDGLLGEKWLPSNPSMSKAEFYSGITSELRDQAKKLLMFFTPKYTGLPTAPSSFERNTPQQIADGLKMGVLRVSVDGNYEVNQDGLIQGTEADFNGKLYYYNHSTACYGGEQDFCHYIHDNYNSQFLKFVWDYPLGGAKILWVKKNFPTLVKEIGKSAVYGFLPSLGKYAAFSDGAVAGGDVFKAFFGGYTGIEKVEKIPEEFISDIRITTVRDGKGLRGKINKWFNFNLII